MTTRLHLTKKALRFGENKKYIKRHLLIIFPFKILCYSFNIIFPGVDFR